MIDIKDRICDAVLPCLKDTKAPISKLTFGPALL